MDVEPFEKRGIARFALGHPREQIGEFGEYGRSRRRLLSARLHYAHARGFIVGDLQERLVNTGVKILAGALEPIRARAPRGAREPRAGRTARYKQDGTVGTHALAGKAVRTIHELA